MWNPFKAIGNWFQSLADKIGAFVRKVWDLAKPFLKEVLSQSAQNVWASSQDLFVAAAQYVQEQGLPTTEDKQKAFSDYMARNAKDELSQLKESELNLLREMAVAILKKIQEQQK